MKILRTFAAAFFAASLLSVTALAADPVPVTNLTGIWNWTSPSPTGPVVMVAKLVQKDGKLSGTVTGRQGPAEIADVSFKGNAFSFKVTRTAGTQVTHIRYKGTIRANTITGTIEWLNADGELQAKQDWSASRKS